MRLAPRRKPNVKRLRRKRNLDRLREALHYREIVQDDDGSELDVGVLVRVDAAEALGDFPATDVAGDLGAALADPEPAVRIAAIQSLRALGSLTVVEPLVECATGIPDRDEEVVSHAVDLLVDWEPEGAAELFVERMLTAGAPPVDDWHQEVLQRLLDADPRGPRARDAVADLAVETLRNPPTPATEASAEAILGRLGPGVADRVLGPLGDGAVTPGLVRAAGLLGDARIVEPVIGNLGSDDPEMRRSAAYAAGALNHTRAVPALLAATQDQEQPVRDAASAALNRMGMAAVIAGLAEIVGRDGAAQVLPHAGNHGALPAEVLTEARESVEAAAPVEEPSRAPAPTVELPPAPYHPRARRGGLVDRLLGRAR